MAVDVERLVVRLEATQRTFERQLAKANQTADRRARQIETRFQKMNKSVSASAAGIGRSFAGAFAGAIFAGGAVGLVNNIKGVVSELSQMGKEMDRVGLSAKAFQELRFGFELAGVSQSEFTKGMEQFAKRVGEASMGTGRLFEILEANGVSIRDVNGRFKSTEELLRVYADLVQNAASEQEKMTLATEAFGRGGAAFVNALKNGALGFDEMARHAEEAGGTIDEKLIRKAEELDDEWAKAWRRFEISAKSAILTVIPIIETLDDKARDFLSNLPVVRLADYLFSDAPETVDAVEQEIDSLERRIVQLQQTIEKNTELGFDNTEALAAIGVVEDRIAQLRGQIQVMNSEAQRSYVVGTPGDPNALAQEASRAGLRGTAKKTVLPTRPSGGGGGGGGGGSRNASAAAVLREADAVTALISELQRELDLIGATDLEREKANMLRRAGSAATEEQKAKIAELVEQIAQEEDALRRSKETMEEISDIGQDFVGGFIRDLQSGASAADALSNALSRVADKLLDIALSSVFGGGGFGNLLGGIFGFADGGIASRGRPHGPPLKRYAGGGVSRTAAIFGEAGPEAAVPLPDGRRIPVDLRLPKATGAQGMSLNMPINIDARNADAPALARLTDEVRGLKRDLPRQVKAIIHTQQVRGV
ncbi:hypothetical protein GN330_16465 [Nitratireductor sp. CAU 1489]|uniref:Tail tape measure protein n=1 Tax=Nitratireductor arenosus TaxID=2682096 RepID=A0A844QHB2_9HYPH|nr:hypothetical protein [Nitratireductor arenosus]MVA98842.1 hypothetical protein [Nitratireductor arenosus]